MFGLFHRSFSTHARRVAIWEKAARIPGCDKAIWRCDDAGRVIRWDDYHDYFSTYGWTVSDQLKPGWLAAVLGLTVAKPAHWKSDEVATARPRRPDRSAAPALTGNLSWVDRYDKVA